MPRSPLILAAAALCLIAFIYTCYSLISSELRTGNVYPELSVLRADPAGTRILFQSLIEMGKEPVRNVTPLFHILNGKPGKLIFLGMSESKLRSLSQKTAKDLDSYVKKGGRLLITFPSNQSADDDDDSSNGDPDSLHVSWNDDSPDHKTDPNDDEKASQEEVEKREYEDLKKEYKKAHKEDDLPDFIPSLLATWGFGVKSDYSKNLRETFAGSIPPGVETHLPWHSNEYFVRLAPGWNVLYSIQHHAVAINRKLGEGSITVLSDSYIFTNQCLKEDRRPGFLAWVINSDQPIFDETHLGSENGRGVASMISQFGVEGYIFGAILVFLLYIWRSSSPLQPIQSDESMAASSAGGAVAGRDARSGLISMLRRNIPEREIIKVCLQEWKRSHQHSPIASSKQAKTAEEMAESIPQNEADLVNHYQQIAKVLNENKSLYKKQ